MFWVVFPWVILAVGVLAVLFIVAYTVCQVAKIFGPGLFNDER